MRCLVVVEISGRRKMAKRACREGGGYKPLPPSFSQAFPILPPPFKSSNKPSIMRISAPLRVVLSRLISERLEQDGVSCGTSFNALKLNFHLTLELIFQPLELLPAQTVKRKRKINIMIKLIFSELNNNYLFLYIRHKRSAGKGT